ncbi:CD226 antigen isoform 1-T2 [Polymixia lowei]
MDAVQKDHWYFMVLLIFLPFLKVAVQQRETLTTVRLEEGMVLECRCPWDGNLSMVSWTRVPDKIPIAVFHPDFGMAFSPRYKERIEFLRITPMDGSIAMTNITHQDIGLYHCSIQTFPRGSWTRNIQVEDSDEPPEDESAETPAPEVVEVDAELVAERDDNSTISCNHDHNGTVYQVVVERMARGQPWGIMGLCKVVDGRLVGEEYTQRGRVRCTDSLNVSLHLTEVVEEDGGFYRCKFITDAGVHTTTVLLTVPSPGEFTLSQYMMYIYIGAGGAGLILFIVMFILAVRHSKRNRREEYRVKLHPAQRQPNHYENIPVYRMGKRHKQVIEGPIYANVQTERHKTKRMSAV